jgi:competence protein ComEC
LDDLKVPLFANYKERFVAFFILLVIFFSNFLYEYYKFQKITSKKFYETKAQVLNQYKKNGHFVLKLKSSEKFTFYTTSKEDLKDLTGRFVDILLIKTKFNITFLDYLKNFYTVSYIKRVLPKILLKEKISKFISLQHKSKNCAALYNALFVAKPLNYELREKLSFLGLSHLVAISGFHIGLISAFLFFLFYLFYSPLHQKFFPYRNKMADAMIFVSIISFLYVYFLGEVASVLRAYIMMIAAFFLYYRHIKILSFETLLWVVLFILANFVKLLFGVGFWLSVAGVFYIYLFDN